jgi:hypothetical protein
MASACMSMPEPEQVLKLRAEKQWSATNLRLPRIALPQGFRVVCSKGTLSVPCFWFGKAMQSGSHLEPLTYQNRRL